MKISEFKNLVKETLKQIKENQPTVAPKPTTAPPAPGKPKPRRPFGNPDVKPKPKANMEEGKKDMLNKIVQRYQQLKK